MSLLRTVVLALACSGIVSYATPVEQSQLVIQDLYWTQSPVDGSPMRAGQIVSGCRNSNQVALTFDDGPYIYNADISRTLSNNGAKGTFFVNGNNWACIYDQTLSQYIKNAYAAGHQFGSHTWAHKDLTTLSWDQINDEMWRVEQALLWITGAYPAMMRPPYGNYNDLVVQAASVRGQNIILWDFDSGDSTGSPPAQSKAAYDAKISEHPRNILALNHETYETTAHDVLPYAIQKLKAAGYQLVTVAECTGLPAYQHVGAPSPRNSSWHC